MAWLEPTTTRAHLVRQADDLCAAAADGDLEARQWILETGARTDLDGARHAIAKRHHVSSWQRLEHEIQRRDALDRRDASDLERLLDADARLAGRKLTGWRDIRTRVRPLGYLARSATPTGPTPPDLVADATATIARLLLAYAAPVDGGPGDPETPLITAARTGDAAMVRVLVEAGAELEAKASPDAPGVPEGTALLHAAVGGHTEALDVLVAAGARILGLGTAAAAGDLTGWPVRRATRQSRVDALVFAADHERLDVIDQLLDAGTPIDAEDPLWGRQALRVAQRHGRQRSVSHLLARGADPRVLSTHP